MAKVSNEGVLMSFLIYQCTNDPDYFIITDEGHKARISGRLCPSGGELEALGNFEEMGLDRAAFDETLAKNSIERQGFYRLEVPGRAAVPLTPEMPG